MWVWTMAERLDAMDGHGNGEEQCGMDEGGRSAVVSEAGGADVGRVGMLD